MHPPLRMSAGMNMQRWRQVLPELMARFQPRTIVPAEGDLATAADVHEFEQYLSDLSDEKVEFNHCRQKYDWMEIPSQTSLEENFDLLRGRKEYTSLDS